MDEYEALDYDEAVLTLGRKINKQLNQNVVAKYDVDVRYNKLFWLGFYDKLVAKYGEERTDYIVNGRRVPDSIRIISEEAEAYGIKSVSPVYIKKALMIFTSQVGS